MLRLLTGSLVLAALAGACGRDNATDTATTGSSQSPRLEGRTFLSSSITKEGTPTTLAIDGIGIPGRASIAFLPGGRLNANAGCNGVTGRYQMEGAVLRMIDKASTLVGCNPAVEAQDTWFRSFVTGGPTLELDDNTLTLSNGSTKVVFEDREVADPDRPLVGPTWTVDTVYTGGGTVGSSAGAKPSLVFQDGGTLTYQDSCAGGRARWSRQGDQITFSDREANPTAVACPPSDSLEEEALTRTLAGSWTLTIEGPRMDLRRGEEGIGLSANSTAPRPTVSTATSAPSSPSPVPTVSTATSAPSSPSPVPTVSTATSAPSGPSPVPSGGNPFGSRAYRATSVTVDGAQRSIIGGTNQIMLSFSGSNSIGARAGCNHFSGTFHVEGSTLRVDNTAVTTMGCDPAASDQDAFVFGFLTSSPAFTLAGTQLVLSARSTVFAFVESS